MKKYVIECHYYPPYNLDTNYHIMLSNGGLGGFPFWYSVFSGNEQECKDKLKEIKARGN